MKLTDRFETLGRTRSPDLWSDIERREPGPPMPQVPRGHRTLTAAVALAVATAAIGLTVRAFLGTGERGPVTTPAPIVPKANGAIWFRVGDGDAPSFIYEINPDGTGQRLVFGSESDPLRYSQIAWSPDGSRIAYIDPIVGKRGVYVSDPDGVDPPQLTYGVNDGWPAWSPDGTRIAFSSTRYDPNIEVCTPAGDFLCPTDIYVMDANGSNVKRLTYDPVPEYHPVWSPDGTKIAFVQTFNGTATAIYAMNSDGTDVRQVSSHDGGSDFSPSWSPDGSRIVFSSIRFEDWRIFVVNPDGTDEHSILDSGGFVDQSVWSPDGKLIAFVGSGFGDFPDGHALYVMQLDGSDIRRLSSQDLEYGVAGDIAWQPLPTASPMLSPYVAATIPVGAFPRAIAVGEGAVWATVDNATGGSDDWLVVKIDPGTNEILDTIPTRDAGDIAVGAGAVWVTSSQGGDGVVVRVDPGTGEVVTTIPVGPGLSNVEFGFGAVWVTLNFGGDPPAGEVVRIDPDANEIVARAPVNGGWPRDIAIGEGSVWVYGHSRLTGRGWDASSLWRIDPLTNELATVLDQQGFLGDGGALPDNLAAGEGVVWAADDEGNGVRIDPATGAVNTFEVEDGFSWPFLAYGGKVFFGLHAVKILDTRTLEVVGSIDLNSSVVDAALDASTGSLWITNYEDSITRIDLR